MEQPPPTPTPPPPTPKRNNVSENIVSQRWHKLAAILTNRYHSQTYQSVIGKSDIPTTASPPGRIKTMNVSSMMQFADVSVSNSK